MSKQPHGFELIVASTDKHSLKRIAWAYGTAKKGSEEEKALLAVLVSRIQGGDDGAA